MGSSYVLVGKPPPIVSFYLLISTLHNRTHDPRIPSCMYRFNWHIPKILSSSLKVRGYDVSNRIVVKGRKIDGGAYQNYKFPLVDR